MTLPDEYVRYCGGDSPKEGGLSVDPGWFQLWSPAEIEQLNRDYDVAEFAPGFLGFGSSGGGELLAFDAGGRVFMIPVVGMSADEARPVADTWTEFVERMEIMPDDDLIRRLEAITDEDGFVAFIAALASDREDEVRKEERSPSSPYGPGANGWENGSIEAFLERAAAFAQDWKRNPEGLPKSDNPWKRCARIIYAGKYYE